MYEIDNIMLGAPVIVKPHWGNAQPGKITKVTKTSFTVTYDDGKTDRFTRRGRQWGDVRLFATYARVCTFQEAEYLRIALAK